MTTEIKVLMDSSGSMHKIKEDSIGGYNEFLQTQQRSENAPNMTWSLYTFNNSFQTEFYEKPISQVAVWNEDDFHPAGGTALYDAIGTMLNQTIEKAGKSYIVVIITDGLENASTTYTTSASIKELIDNKTSDQRGPEDALWDFVYLGANQDAILESRKIGIRPDATLRYHTTKGSMKAVYDGVSQAISRKISNRDVHVAFTPLERTTTESNDAIESFYTSTPPHLQRLASRP